MTSTRPLDAVLREHPFFEGLDPRYLEILAGCARNERFAEGEFLYRENQPADKLYLLRQGQVMLELYSPQLGPVPIVTVREGDVLGSAWIIPPYRAGCDARALEVVRAVSLDGPCMRTKCELDPALGYALMKRSAKVLVERLMYTRLQLLDLYGATPTRRPRAQRPGKG